MKGKVLFAVSALALLTSTVSAGGSWKPVSKGVSRGNLATTSLWGDAPSPSAMRLIVNAVPNQRVDVSWRVSCVTADFDYASRSRDFEAMTPVERDLPVTMQNAEYCSTYVSASNNEGKIVTKVQYR
jgi:hypothetical protein